MGDGEFHFRVEGDVQRFGVEALGEPGQRRFRLLAVIEDRTHIVWLEKQQVQALGLALEQVLAQLPDEGPDLSPGNAPVAFDVDTRFQFRAGHMELGYDEDRDRLVVIAHDIEDPEEGPRLACRITRAQAREFSAEAGEVVAAGRPRCVLCGSPMGPGPHSCPQQNGHLPTEIEREAGDDADEADL